MPVGRKVEPATEPLKEGQVYRDMTVRAVQFAALVITALALVPSAVHLATLLNKIGLSQADYFTVQGIYRGWAIPGALWPTAIIFNAVLAYLVRAQQWPFWLAIGAASCFVLMLAIFLFWTLPANQETESWTSVPENWDTLRRQWEYSHAVNAGIVFMAFCLTALSVLSWRPSRM